MPNVKQMPNRQDAEDLRDAIDQWLDENQPGWREPTHVGSAIKTVILTEHECAVIDKPGNSPLAGVVMTSRAETLPGNASVAVHPRTGAPFNIDITNLQDFVAGGWREPDPVE